MKPRVHFFCPTAMPFSAMLLCLTLGSPAASGQTNATAKPSPSTAVSNSLSATQEIPRSVFVVPAAAGEGKDPFFPRSIRPYGSTAPNVTTNPQPQSLTADLFVAGFSGGVERPLAIINTTTFGVGDENDVIAKGRRVRVRCLEINMQTGTVLIQVGSERKVLRFKQGN